MKELVDSILTCSTSSEGWDRTLDLFNAEFGITAASMFAISQFENLSTRFYMSEFNRRNATPDFLKEMQEGADEDDRPAYDHLFRNAPLQLFNEPAMFGVNEYQDLPPSRVRDFTESLGLVMRVGAVLNKNGPWLDGLFLQCKSDVEWQSLLQDSRTDIILPIMGNSIALCRLLQTLRAQFNASLSVLDSLGLAVFLVDASGTVIENNTEAQSILDDKDGISMNTDKRFKLHSHDKTKELEALIFAANGLFNGDLNNGPAIMALQRPSGAYEYLISVRSLSDSHSELEQGLKCAFVTVIDPARRNVLSAEGIAILGQLSDAERNVVDMIVQGFRLAEIAERREVSQNTVKTQLKTISEKLRCSSQSNIIRVAAATRIPIKK